MKLISKDFKHKKVMDTKFGYRKGNLSPHLKWEDVPKDTKSFALLCKDPDAGDWIHWMVINIPSNVGEISQDGPVPGDELKNDFGKIGYGGPAPPSGTHRYFFQIFALNIEKFENVNKHNFMQQVKKHTIESAEILGLYRA
ncbi:MAG: YbhB/YbcL family Raf kinase inhibitor-like protein [Candidatus Lokiarchaeota archaeon]|jgi:Raf kinase inhibitor-like YbhB/YbcL family protein